MPTISVDLGSGKAPRNPYNYDKVIGVEANEIGENIINCWIGLEPIPLEDSSVDAVTAYDFLEHLPRAIWKDGKMENAFINTMNEAWRILKPGGLLLAVTPAYPAKEAFQDPTHVNIITEQTIGYFTGRFNNIGRRYGFIGNFNQRINAVGKTHIKWELEAIKTT